MADFSAPALQSLIRRTPTNRSLLLGASIFLSTIVLYALSLYATYEIRHPLLRLIASAGNGLSIGLLFIVGHDACHQSLTNRSEVNSVLGRIAFLPSLHPYVCWKYSHNVLHHVWTNLKGSDPVYAPLTLTEYRALSPGRRYLERFQRSPIGMFLLYGRNIWWNIEIAPSKPHRTQMKRYGRYWLDLLFVVAFLVAEIGACVSYAIYKGGATLSVVTAALAYCVFVPFVVWNWLIGFVTFHHHTHPLAVWFDKRETWTSAKAQIHGTLHVVPPCYINALLLYILEHPAHHVDPGLPLYRLKGAQAALDSVSMRYRWSLRECAEIFRICRLYDYEKQQWLDYDGKPLSWSDSAQMTAKSN